MKCPSAAFLKVGLFVCATGAIHSAPLNLKRDTTFAPAATIVPDKRTPATNQALSAKRVETVTVSPLFAAVNGQRSPIAVQEAVDKRIISKNADRPQPGNFLLHVFNRAPAAISTASSTQKPVLVEKYRAGLAAAHATASAHYSPGSRDTAAQLNRFISEKNKPDSRPPTTKVATNPAGNTSGTVGAASNPTQPKQ